MVYQKLFENIGLILVTENGKSCLYKISKEHKEKSFEMKPLSFLPEQQNGLEVYPEANLIITQDTLFTFDGTVVSQHDKSDIEIISGSKNWIIFEKMRYDNCAEYQVTFWNGYKELDSIKGRNLLKNDKYFAIYVTTSHCWCVYTYDGTLVLKLENTESTMNLCGNFLIASGIGNYTAYSLLETKTVSADQHLIFDQKQLMLFSTREDFGLCADWRGIVQTYHKGKYRNFGKSESIELYDEIGIFSLKRDGRYFFYHLDGSPYSENIFPCGADFVAYNKEDGTLLIGVNGLFCLTKP